MQYVPVAARRDGTLQEPGIPAVDPHEQVPRGAAAPDLLMDLYYGMVRQQRI